jgi:hypothetical protein
MSWVAMVRDKADFKTVASSTVIKSANANATGQASGYRDDPT